VGQEHFFLFGMTTDEVVARAKSGYRGREIYESNPVVREVLDLISSGFFSPEEKHLFKPLVDGLLGDDRYMVLADFEAYMKAQEEVARAYLNPKRWWKSAIINVARMGFFSSDRTIKEYAKDIWDIHPVPMGVAERANGAPRPSSPVQVSK
jgi:starch phosphorylase